MPVLITAAELATLLERPRGPLVVLDVRWKLGGPPGHGDYLTGHRCPGEAMTVDLVKSALHLLASEVVYTVPRQDLSIDLSRMPALPASRFQIEVAAPVL